MPKETVVVLGAGIMGSGIGQTAAMAGHSARLFDVGEEPLARARAAIDRSLTRFMKAGKFTQVEAENAMARITFSSDVDDASRDADVVIEAVPEILELKQQVMTAAIRSASPTALIGTNTSQLSITRIAAGLGSAAPRVVGVHFFNPPVVMQLVELIRGLATTDETLERAQTFATGLGKEVVVCRKDSPGFLTSRAYAILRLECVRMIEEGLASPADVDKAFRLGFNFPMGPLELGDFNGLDTFVHVLDSLSTAHGERFRPTPILRNMIAAGHLGRKTGEGFYRYDEAGKRIG